MRAGSFPARAFEEDDARRRSGSRPETGPAEGLARIGREIQAEKAATLARIAGTLEDLIAQLGRLGGEAFEADRPQDREQALAQHSELREKALRYRWYLEVQREAVGFTRHDALDEMYPVPPPLTREPPRR